MRLKTVDDTMENGALAIQNLKMWEMESAREMGRGGCWDRSGGRGITLA